MTIPVTLANVGSLLDATTAQTTLNNNNGAIVTGFENALDTSGDQMEGNLDMNSNRLLNLPAPQTSAEPARLQDLATLSEGGTIIVNPLPSGGTTGQVLEKNSNSNYDVSWQSLSTTVNTIDGQSGTFTTGNGIDSSGKVIELTAARRTLPTQRVFTSGSGTYTTPTNCLWLKVTLLGAGGGGGSGGNGTAGTAGGTTSFSTQSSSGGLGGGAGSSSAAGGIGGTSGGGTLLFNGTTGTSTVSGNPFSGAGGSSALLYGGGQGVAAGNGAPGLFGGGGSGGFSSSGGVPGAGGGGGGSSVGWIFNPSSTYSYSVGVGGTGGVQSGGGTNTAGAGGSGIIIVEEFYN